MRPATLQDVLHIRRTMWERGKQELAALRKYDPVTWIAEWNARIVRGEAVAFGNHAILGIDRDGEEIVTAFQASTSFEEPGVGIEVTKEMRAAIPMLMVGRGLKTVCTYSLCIHPEAAAWFRCLGLREDKTYNGKQYGDHVMRRFVRRV